MANSGLSSSIQNYHNRLLALEIELKDMARLGYLRGNAYQKRLLALSKTKKHLLEYQRELRESQEKISRLNDPWEIPTQFFLEPKMNLLCDQFYKNLIATLKYLVKESMNIGDLMRKTIEIDSSFEWTRIFRLSRLRRKLIQFENKMNQLRQDHRMRENYAKTVLKVALGSDRYNMGLLESLRKVAQDFRDSEEHLALLKEQIERKREQLRWLEQWLGFQEQRIFRHLPKVIRKKP